jgi:anti-sigma regulatory factor (Ser/Thr protein kinase)
MQFKPHKSYHIQDRSHISYTKREIIKLTEGYGFDRGKIEIIVAELSSNIIKHSALQGGEILIRFITSEETNDTIELLSIDLGPGMAHPSKMMEDGISTSGTPGTGLGAIRRLSHEFEIFSQAGNGTIVLVRYYKKGYVKRKPTNTARFEVSSVMLSKRGEIKCGDGGFVEFTPEKVSLLVADGLGHGPEAEIASDEAVDVFKANINMSPSEIVRLMHVQIKRTRGIVGAVVKLDLKEKSIAFVGIGNIAGKIISPELVKNLVSYNGTIGHNIPTTIHDHVYPFPTNSLLVLNSDGIKSRWELTKYGDLFKYDPAIIAALIYRDNTRNTDDVLVVVGKAVK